VLNSYFSLSDKSEFEGAKMSIEKVKAYFETLGMLDRVMELGILLLKLKQL